MVTRVTWRRLRCLQTFGGRPGRSPSCSANLSAGRHHRVGAIANLALFFAIHTLFASTTSLTWGPARPEVPALGTLRPVVLGIGVAATVLLFRLRWPVLRTLGVCAALGVAAGLVAAAAG